MEDQIRILIVDGDPLQRKATGVLLSNEGYAILEAGSGSEALHLAHVAQPDMVLLQTALPDVSDLDICRRIKAAPALGETRVVLLSSGPVSSDAQAEALEQGADAYLVSPGSERELIARVRAVLRVQQQEKRLARREREVAALIDHAPDTIARLDRELRHVYVNPAAARAAGIPREAFIGKTNQELGFPEELVALWDAATREVLDTGQERTTEFTFHTPDGARHFQSRLVPESRSDGVVEYVLLISRDVTEHRQNIERLRLLQAAAEATANAVVLTDREGVIVYVNPAFEALTGYAPDEALGKTPRILKSGRQDPASYEHMWNTILAGQVWQGALINRRKDGTLYHEEMTITPVLDDGGAITHFVAIKQDVTRRMQAEQDLRASEERFRIVSGLASDFAYSMRVAPDGSTSLDWVAGAVLRLTGYTPEEVKQRGNWMSIVHPDDRPLADQFTRNLLTRGADVSELRIIDRIGNELWIRSHAQGVWNETEGRVTHIVGAAQDITEERKAQSALRESKQRLDDTLNALDEVVWSVSARTGNLLYVSPAVETVFGRRDTEFYTQPGLWRAAIHPDDLDEVDAWHRMRRESDVSRLEYRIVRPDGAVRWVRDRCRLVRDAHRIPLRLDGIIADVTERRLAEEELSHSQAHLRILMDSIEDTVFTLDDQQRHTAIYGKSLLPGGPAPETVLGKTSRDLHGEEAAQVHEAANRRALDGEHVVYEWSALGPGGETWFLTSLSPMRDAAGHTVGVVGVGRDVTELKQREREIDVLFTFASALRAAPARGDVFRVVVQHVHRLMHLQGVALLMLHDAKSHQLIVVLGYGEWEHWTGLRLPADEGLLGQVMATGHAFRSDDVLGEADLVQPDLVGDARAVACVPLVVESQIAGVLWAGRQAPIADHEMRLLTALGDMAATAIQRATLDEEREHYADQLERRVAERTRELAAANERLQKLDYLKSKLVTDVSHELRTPVANLKLYVDLLERGRPEQHARYIATLQTQADRLARLVESILSLSRLELRGDKVRFVPIDLNALAAPIVNAHRPSAELAGLALRFAPAPDLPPVLGERSQLEQVVTNLIANAINYTPEGEVKVATQLNSHGLVLLVEDTGIGIDEIDLPHIFERFYRGKGVAQSDIPGSGLGLAIVKEIVDLHGGYIDVKSRPGQGSTFSVWLPLLIPDAA